MSDRRPVMVVEDHEDTRLMMQDLLEAVGGWPTVAAENGAVALRMLVDTRPCVILLDLNMPVMDGWEFRERQQCLADRTLSDIPVVIVSALLDCEAHARHLGAIDCLRKPEDFPRIVSVVRRLCGDR